MAIYKSKEKTKDGRQWFFRCRYKNNLGKVLQHESKKYLTKSEAQQEERLFLTKRDNPVIVNFSIVALGYFDNLKQTKKESTYYSHYSVYKTHIKSYFEQKDINNINISLVNEWKITLLKKGYKVNYLNKCYAVLCNIMNYAIKNFGLTYNVVRNSGPFEEKKEEVIEDTKKLRYITYEEFNKFISVIDEKQWYAFFSFLYYTGMRKGEIQALTWNDIDFNNNYIIVNKTLSVKTIDNFKITSTKNNQNRKIKMNKTLIKVLKDHLEYMKQFKEFSKKWYVFGGGTFLRQTTIDRYKHKYFVKSGIKEITIHEFRHSCVSLLINEYVKTGQTDTTKFFIMMSNRMGHTIEVMQETYLHLFPSVQDEIVDILDNL